MKPIVRTTAAVILAAAFGGLPAAGLYVYWVLTFELDLFRLFICIVIDGLISFLVFWPLGRMAVRPEKGSLTLAAVGALLGTALLFLLHYSAWIDVLDLYDWPDWLNIYFPLALPAVGAAIGYNVRRTADPGAYGRRETPPRARGAARLSGDGTE
jgi:hypothetical protein